MCARSFGRALALWIAASGSLASAGDWPRFLGPDANGISTEKLSNKSWNTKPPKMLWSVPMSDGGYSGPSVANGLVMIVDHVGNNDVVRALRLSDGKEAWRFEYEEKVDSQHGFARATPTVSGGKVYTISRMGVAHCLDAKTGKPIWRVDTIQEFGGKVPQWFVSASPLVDGNRVLFTPGGPDASVVALDKNTGKTLWKGGGTGPDMGYATPIVATLAGKRQYVLWLMERLLGLDPATGATLWSFSFPRSCSIATPVQVGQSVFITSGYNKGCALVDVGAQGASARWQNREMQAHISTPVLVGGYLYGNSDPGLLVCLDPSTGTA